MTFYIKLKMSTSLYHYKKCYYNIIKKRLEVISAGCNLKSHENRHGTTIRKPKVVEIFYSEPNQWTK